MFERRKDLTRLSVIIVAMIVVVSLFTGTAFANTTSIGGTDGDNTEITDFVPADGPTGQVFDANVATTGVYKLRVLAEPAAGVKENTLMVFVAPAGFSDSLAGDATDGAKFDAAAVTDANIVYIDQQTTVTDGMYQWEFQIDKAIHTACADGTELIVRVGGSEVTDAQNALVTLHDDKAKVTITFQHPDETPVVGMEPIQVYVGEAATAPTATPSKTDAVFKGWYEEKTLATVVDWAKKITDNTIYYAKFNDLIAVTFDANGGTFDGGTTEVVKVEKDTKPVAPTDNPTTTVENMKFGGWVTTPTGTVSVNLADEPVVTATRTYYANWVDKSSLPDFTVSAANAGVHNDALGNPLGYVGGVIYTVTPDASFDSAQYHMTVTLDDGTSKVTKAMYYSPRRNKFVYVIESKYIAKFIADKTNPACSFAMVDGEVASTDNIFYGRVSRPSEKNDGKATMQDYSGSIAIYKLLLAEQPLTQSMAARLVNDIDGDGRCVMTDSSAVLARYKLALAEQPFTDFSIEKK